MNIKKAAELSGIKTDNIRYYERIGLIPKITRTESGIRNFTEANIRTLKFVKHMPNEINLNQSSKETIKI